MNAQLTAFILIMFAFSAQATSHALRQLNEKKKSPKTSIIWHLWGSCFVTLLSAGLMQLSYSYFVDYASAYETAADKLYSIAYTVLYIALIKFAIFNPCYNIIAGNKLTYAGDSNIFDKGENFVKKHIFNLLPLFLRMLVFVWLLSDAIIQH